MSKDTDVRTTPKWFFDIIDSVFHFEGDAAATKENALCKKYHTEETDGLKSKWWGSTWCNPPYSRGEVIKWVKKAYNEWQNYENYSVLLLKNDTSCDWFQVAHGLCSVMYAKHKRLKFNGSKDTPNFGNILVIFGYSPQRFIELERKIAGRWLKK